MNSPYDDPKGPGFPIRKSADQRSLSSPRGLSQSATSFFASRHRGIHQMPLRRLLNSPAPPRPTRLRGPDFLQSHNPTRRTSRGFTTLADAAERPGADPTEHPKDSDPPKSLPAHRNLPNARLSPAPQKEAAPTRHSRTVHNVKQPGDTERSALQTSG